MIKPAAPAKPAPAQPKVPGLVALGRIMQQRVVKPQKKGK
jgi:hypothetical protein